VEGVSGWELGGHHGECGARAYNGGLGAEPLVTESGGEAPLKLKAFWLLDVQRSRQIKYQFVKTVCFVTVPAPPVSAAYGSC